MANSCSVTEHYMLCQLRRNKRRSQARYTWTDVGDVFIALIIGLGIIFLTCSYLSATREARFRNSYISGYCGEVDE